MSSIPGSDEARPLERDAVGANINTTELPPHLANWELPPDWRWGGEGVRFEQRHFQEIIDALGRSLSLVSAPDPAHHRWLAAEARQLGHRNHPAISTTYHYWTEYATIRRGPGYLRRWISGETVGMHVRRSGSDDVPYVMKLLRMTGSAVAYLHDAGTAHGAVSPEYIWVTPTGRIWLLGWQWALPRSDIPEEVAPDPRWTPTPPEWHHGTWRPTPESDQWQLAATCFMALTGEMPPANDIPPIRLLRPSVPQGVGAALDRALAENPGERHRSVVSMLRALDRAAPSRNVFVSGSMLAAEAPAQSEEGRLRWAVGDDYDVLALLGRGTFGTVWRVRDLTLEREVALKMLHPHVATDLAAVARFRREARMAAQLAHPAIVPIYDLDSRGEVTWYTMELAEAGSVADLVASRGPRPLREVAPQVDLLLDALVAAHASGIVHRDLKPENILIDRYRRWRVADFGIARMTDEEIAGATGTPAFAAPEQLLGESQGPAVDLFALAAIVVFVLSGEPPFPGRDGPSILAQQLSGKLDLHGFEPPLADWLSRAMAVDVEERFGQASEMQRTWVQVMERLMPSARRPSGLWSRLRG
ncbi:MAG TPA: serine/threonine-protein kinase [Gemmatimonadaceae bacterium]|nr:serine/threonine-protein kinase [Gemmatimonadaceae bacterium]